MAYMGWATHVLQWQEQREAMSQGGANPQILSQSGLLAATREHEVGIASNRGSARRGEFVTGLCTHRLSHPGNWFCLNRAEKPLIDKHYNAFVLWVLHAKATRFYTARSVTEMKS